MKKITHWLLALASLLALTAHAADGFKPGDWDHRQKTLIDTTAEGVELKQGVSQFPLALRLHTGNFAFAEAKPDGSDLRLTAGDGKTPLHFHFEKYDAVNELAIIWVQQPKLAPLARTDAVELFWGNEKATAATDVKGSYDAAQNLVLHFSGDGPLRDATGYGNNPSDLAITRVPGPLADAASLDGSATLSIPGSPNLKLIAANGLTFTAWVKPAADVSATLFQQSTGGIAQISDKEPPKTKGPDATQSLALAIKGNRLVAEVNGMEFSSKAILLTDAWQHVALTYASGKLSFYLDGLEAGTAEATLGDLDGDVHIGAGFRGLLDEVTLAGTARSADYIKALHGSQQADSLMLVESEDEGGGEGASYLGILLGALTVDGWVVIGILGVMGIVSFAVMIGKTLYLARANKANEAFLENFRANSNTLLRPDSEDSSTVSADDSLRASTIARLYQIGIGEMRHRFAGQTANGNGNSLSAAALDSIRAAMDAALVRENQRLNSQIVLLTIAISGGPFLGLLGTVVGVMITFAAIAAAGDVNVNAIAPGIAAALVATVAGLAVAIPALFGYNWLAIKIKNVSADTQVFADEFLTKSAELYAL